jgi:hypothetical protein
MAFGRCAQYADSLLDWRGKILPLTLVLIALGLASLNTFISGLIYLALLALYKKQCLVST